MRRRLSVAGSAVSLLLCLAMISLWVRSHWTMDGVTLVWVGSRAHVIHTLMIHSEWGCIRVYKYRQVVFIPDRFNDLAEKLKKWAGWEMSPAGQKPRSQDFWDNLGFRYSAQTRSFPDDIGLSTATLLTQDDTFFMVPDWIVILVGAILPAWWLTRWTQRFRRRRLNHCLACSYNLTGNTSGVCPECGTPVAEKAKA